MKIQTITSTTLASTEVTFALENNLWLNATEVARQHGKRLDNYWRDDNDTNPYLDIVAKRNSVKKANLSHKRQGRNGGTYIARELFVHFLLYVGMHINDIKKLDCVTKDMIEEYIEISGKTTRKKVITKSSGVYLLTDGREYKIGIASNIYKRVKQIQTGSPYKIKVLVFSHVKNAKEIESYLHNEFNERRLCGEWFSLSNDNIDECIEIITKGKI